MLMVNVTRSKYEYYVSEYTFKMLLCTEYTYINKNNTVA